MENLQKTQAAAAVVVDVDAVDGSSHPNNKQSEGEEHIGSSSESGSCSEIVKERSSVSAVDLECGAPEIKLHLAKVERDCRICHLTMDAGNLESGVPFELGCSCKDDLAAAHKQCAEAWFKIKGNKTCEICGSVARNVAGVNETELAEQWNQATDGAMATTTAPVQPAETRNFWQGHQFLNFLLACMVYCAIPLSRICFPVYDMQLRGRKRYRGHGHGVY
ncbi:hypothetical protein NC652_020633 [Populus alba x Populus x berolinensis]|nr:hypothetical protein NC652_020633 [Populus alba x Populus x berolinensis]